MIIMIMIVMIIITRVRAPGLGAKYYRSEITILLNTYDDF